MQTVTSLFNFALTIAPVPLLVDAVLISNRIHNTFFAVSTFMYLLLIQTRFRVIKSILPYRNLYDYLFVIVTIIVWCGTTFLFGIVAFGSVSPAQSLAFSALWTLYALIVDNILSWLFLYHLFKCRAQVSNTDRLKRLWSQSVIGLGILAGTTWICLILTAIATFAFAKDNVSRALMYRVAYCFSPVQFSGSLVCSFFSTILLSFF